MNSEQVPATYKAVKKIMSTAKKCVRLYKLAPEQVLYASACFSARCIISTGVDTDVYISLLKSFVDMYKGTNNKDKENKV